MHTPGARIFALGPHVMYHRPGSEREVVSQSRKRQAFSKAMAPSMARWVGRVGRDHVFSFRPDLDRSAVNRVTVELEVASDRWIHCLLPGQCVAGDPNLSDSTAGLKIGD